MKLIRDRVSYPEGSWVTALATGYFDGIHKGHQAVIHAAGSYAKAKGIVPAVFTFTRPYSLKGKRLLQSFYKHRELENMGVEYCFEPDFSVFHNLPAKQFFKEMLCKEYHVKAIFCGENFAFGAGKSGNVSLLKQWCEKNGIDLVIIPTAFHNDEAISSTRIRRAVHRGDVQEAHAMLGRPFMVEMPVKNMSQNSKKELQIQQIYPVDMQSLKEGIYLSDIFLDGKVCPSVSRYSSGTEEAESLDGCETTVTDFSGSFSGKSALVRFHKWVGPLGE